jgi:hypothetical protein
MIKLTILLLWRLLWIPVFYIDDYLSGVDPFGDELYILIRTDKVTIEVTPWLGILLCMLEWCIIYLIYNVVRKPNTELINHLIE